MNEYDQSDVAYENGPKEVRVKKKDDNKQFPGDKMPQGNKTANGGEYVEKDYPANPRHCEYR